MFRCDTSFHVSLPDYINRNLLKLSRIIKPESIDIVFFSQDKWVQINRELLAGEFDEFRTCLPTNPEKKTRIKEKLFACVGIKP